MIGGLAIGAVVLVGGLLIAFFTYEASWKLRRLGSDVRRLRGLNLELGVLVAELTRLRARAAAGPTQPGRR